MKMDGQKRATNSQNWKLIETNDFEFSRQFGIQYVGNKGDLLTLVPSPKKLKNLFQAILQWYSYPYAFTSKGFCSASNVGPQ